jgi:hypothetical protein
LPTKSFLAKCGKFEAEELLSNLWIYRFSHQTMKIYRGPKQKSFFDDTHELVATVTPKKLEEGVREKARMTFNITKDGTVREAVCTAIFEDSDLVPMANGLLARLALQQESIAQIKKIVEEKIGDIEKLQKIKAVLEKLK